MRKLYLLLGVLLMLNASCEQDAIRNTTKTDAVSNAIDSVKIKAAKEAMAIGGHYYGKSQYDSAIFFFKEAIAINKRNNFSNSKLNGKAYRYTGQSFDDLFYIDSTEIYYARAEAIFKKINNDVERSKLYRTVARFKRKIGDFQECLVYGNKGLAIVKDTSVMAEFHLDLANCLNDLGKMDSSIYHSQQLLDLYATCLTCRKRELRIAHAYNNIAISLDLKGQKEEALKHYFMAKRQYGNIQKGKAYLPMCDNNISTVFHDLNNYRKALRYADSALTGYRLLYDSLAFHPAYANVYDNKGNAHEGLGQADSALYCYQKALQNGMEGFRESDSFKNPDLIKNRILWNKAHVLEYLKDKATLLNKLSYERKDNAYQKAALETYRLASQLIDNMRFDHRAKGSQFFWRGCTRPVYAGAIRAAYQAKDHALGFYFLEKSKAAMLEDAIRALKAKNLLPDIKQKQETRFQNKLWALEQQLAAATNREEKNDLDIKIKTLKVEQLKFIQDLEKDFPAYHQFKYNTEVLDIATVQEQLLDDSTTLINYFITNENIFVLSISADSTEFHQLHKAKIFKNHVNELVKSMRTKSLSKAFHYVDPSYSLYRQLFEPLDIQTPKVIVVADGISQHIPFSALLTNKKNPYSYLLHEHIFSYAYSAGILAYGNATRKKGHKMLTVAPVNFQHDNYENLPYSQQEVKHIYNIMQPAFEVKILLEKEANKSNFLQQAPQFDFIHFSTHATANIDNNKEPEIIFQDGALSLSEIFRLELKADLVVLSACETSQGNLIAGEGIMSLARGFAFAGVPATISSLWKVPEKSTTDLMGYFYQYLNQGYAKNEALQLAKRDLIATKEDNYQTPYFWGAFIQIGVSE